MQQQTFSRAEQLPITSIKLGGRRRALNAAKVEELAKSIRDIGLLNPITVTEQYDLVAGFHRLDAYRLLGWETIPTTVVPLSGLTAELAEIDENLIRNELTALEHSNQIKRRKEIYEALHPSARPEEQRKKGLNVSAEIISALEETPTFAEDTAAKTGVTPRTIRQEVQIAANIPEPVQDAIRDTPLADKKAGLLLLSQQPAEAQAQIVEQIQSGAAKNVREAKAALTAAMLGASDPDEEITSEEALAALTRQEAAVKREMEKDSQESPKRAPGKLQLTPVETSAIEKTGHIYFWISRLADAPLTPKEFKVEAQKETRDPTRVILPAARAYLAELAKVLG